MDLPKRYGDDSDRSKPTGGGVAGGSGGVIGGGASDHRIMMKNPTRFIPDQRGN